MKNLKIDGFVFQIVNEAEAIERINQNKEVLILHKDGSESVAETIEEIKKATEFGLKFAHEINTQSDQKKATEKETRKAQKFYDWFKSLGGNLSVFNVESIFSSCSESLTETSSFKSNPEATKQKYNHKFNLS
jgi:hypothetical protein